jgi:hypothetical protein
VLSDRQQKAVLDATFALDEHQRHAFMTSLASLLANQTEVGDGELFQILRETVPCRDWSRDSQGY